MHRHEEEQSRRLTEAAQSAVDDFLPTIMRNPTETQKTVARIIALNCYTKGITDDDAIKRLFHARSCLRSDALKVRDALRPALGEFLTLARDRMAEVA